MSRSWQPGWPWERDDPGIAIDPGAMDALVHLFAQCRELGIEVSPHMPLDTPGHQRQAVLHLSRVIAREGRP